MSGYEKTRDFFAKRAAGWENFVKKEWLPDIYDHYYTLLASAIIPTGDPVRILDLGCGGGIASSWRDERSDDWCSVAYWYQNLTKEPLPPVPPRAERIRDIAQQPWELEALKAFRAKKMSSDGAESGLVF